MSTPNGDGSVVSRFTETVGMGHGERYEIKLDELEVILSASYQLNMIRQELLTALQRSVPMLREDDTEQPTEQTLSLELKDALTNVIIMQDRLNGRDHELLELLKQAVERQAIDGVRVEPQVVRQWAWAVIQASARLRVIPDV